jgi:hypothetical protein
MHTPIRPVRRAAAAAMLALLAGCGPLPWPRGSEPDLCPPGIESVSATGPASLVITFDEDAELDIDALRIEPALRVLGVSAPGRTVAIDVDTQSPGREYCLEATARDSRGNSTTFLAGFYGFNARIPRVIVNEFTPRGSTDHPDLVELKVLTDGDMGGLVLYAGTPSNFDARLVFPSFEVSGGSFIVVHCRPTGDAVEVDEIGDPAVSGGIDASPKARDFWLRGGQGLGGNNGVLSLYERPGGPIIDGLLYSNRTSDSDDRYRGFGTSDVLDRAEELVGDGGWRIAGTLVAPEDGISPEGSTATRSLCRSSTSADTDSRGDWHIVPTRGSTFGADNSDEVYYAGVTSSLTIFSRTGRGTAPICCFTICPPLKKRSVGMLWMPKREARSGSSSTLILATLSLPA